MYTVWRPRSFRYAIGFAFVEMRIAGLDAFEFADRTDITCVQLFYFNRTAAFQNVKLADAGPPYPSLTL